MQKIKLFITAILVLFVLQTITSIAQNAVGQSISTNESADAKAVKEMVEQFLLHAGNHNYEAIIPMFLPNANIGFIHENNGKWSAPYSMSFNEWMEGNLKKENPKKFTELVSKYSVHI